MLISTKHLPRDLRIFGVIASIFALMLGATDFLLALPMLANGVVFFVLATGISKKEKWAWLSGLLFLFFLILSNLVSFFLGLITLVYLAIFLIIPALFLITFIRSRKEIVFENKISIILLVLLIIGLIVNISSTVYLSSGSYEQKQKESRQEQLNLQLCQTMACYSAIKGDDGKFYYEYFGKKFDSREGCINYCVELLQETGAPKEEIEAPKERTIDEITEFVPSEVERWQTYKNEEYGFGFEYPETSAIITEQVDFKGKIQINLENNCYIVFGGVPAGLPDVEVSTEKDIVEVGGVKAERETYVFPEKEGFASIVLDYERDKIYPYFFIYHSIEDYCLGIIDQTLSTFKFLE